MKDRLSVSLALDTLQEQCDLLAKAEAQATRERNIRNDLLRDARNNGIAWRRLCRITGLTRTHLNRIVDMPDSDVPAV